MIENRGIGTEGGRYTENKDGGINIENAKIVNLHSAKTEQPEQDRLELNRELSIKQVIKLLEAFEDDLEKRYQVDIKIIGIDKGSIKLTLDGSQEDIERLDTLFKAGELKEVLGIPVEDVRIVTESDNRQLVFTVAGDIDSEVLAQLKAEIAEKRLVEKIRMAWVVGQNLSGTDLSGVNLSGVILSGAILSRANLSRANLRGTDLRWAYLSKADLSKADLSGSNLSETDLSEANLSETNLTEANLSKADLIGANLKRADLISADLSEAILIWADLSGAKLIGANVKKARFRDNAGISESMKADLMERGAIFDDSLGDSSRILEPSRR